MGNNVYSWKMKLKTARKDKHVELDEDVLKSLQQWIKRTRGGSSFRWLVNDALRDYFRRDLESGGVYD